jgi:predicted CxxxxCH...CXXCH cytochrome family protein
MAHPKPWKTHSSAGNLANACALCHGATFAGGVGPACKSCHTQLAPGTNPAPGQCVSCHGNPPNGTTAPNIAGAHANHLALAGMSGNCTACHTGGGSGTANHGATLTLAFASNFNANSGLPAYNGTTSTCTNISCHGGRTTPAWSGTLNVLTSCTACHQSGTAEYIGYHSGQHATHVVDQRINCTDCHDMTDNSRHFGNVTTKLFETLPSATLRSYLTYNVANQSCTVQLPVPSVVQFTGCHTGTRSWNGN